MYRYDEYRLFVEDTARFTERRQTISNIYLTVQSLLVAGIGLWVKELRTESAWTVLLPLPLVAAGFTASLWWRQLIIKYKALVGMRIDTLRTMEDDLPDSVKMYHAEDKLYPRDSKGKKVYGEGLDFCDVELRLPWLFIILYSMFGVGLIIVYFQ